MCGICGIVGFNDKQLIRRMCDIIQHRGPDDKGYYSDKNIELGMRRLSIIDLEGGHQPIHNEDESIWTVFNGEVYNFQKLKSELENLGHNFYTNSDTETLVHCYEEYGDDFVKKIDGMFAIALWDSNNKKLILARDRLGKKPLYYTITNNSLLFGSEIKSLLLHNDVKREVDNESLAYFLKFGYVPNRNTMFKDIFKLMGGNILVYENNEVKIKKYWKLKLSETQEHSDNFYIEKFRALFDESVKKRLISDVPLGVFLSGGLDSSSITSVMSRQMSEPVKTFSICFGNGKWDESKYSDIVAEYFGTDHKKITLDHNAVKILPKIVWHMDEPLADPASIPTYYLSDFAAKKVKVCLVGEGADEILGGYRHHLIIQTMKKINMPEKIRTPISKIIRSIDAKLPNENRFKRYSRFANLIMSAPDYRKLYANLYERISEENDYLLNRTEIQNVYDKFFRERTSILKQIFLFETNVQLQNYLLMKVDKSTMGASIEARVPFLDYNLVEFSADIPDKLKIKGLTSKYILRTAMKGCLPKKILKRGKHPFATPIVDWINKGLKEYAEVILSEENIRRRGFFNYNKIEKMMGAQKNFGMLWPFLVFEIWHRTFIDRENIEKPLNINKII